MIRKPNQAEFNYDVGNQELHSIKAALDEWCHYLEAEHFPFQVITDTKTLNI